MHEPIRAMMICAHPDDCDIRFGGLALKYIQAGGKVKFLSLCDGQGGHHEMAPAEIAARRYGETQAVSRISGVEYCVWDVPDCELTPSLDNRRRLVREIREYAPHIIFTHRPNDYHADHRSASLLVQDASYLLIVPNYCPEAPAMRETPVICHHHDNFNNPPFVTDLVVGIDDVIDTKFLMKNCHVSQFYEWLPYTIGILDRVPTDPQVRLEWLHQPRIDRSAAPDDSKVLAVRPIHNHSEHREAAMASRHRDMLIERYGEAGRNIHFAEAFCQCEYGKKLTKELEKELFPF